MRRLPASILTLLVFYPCGLARGQNRTPDLILFNGKIFTSNSGQPYVEALAICGKRIIATGDSVKIRSLAGSQTKQIDLVGRTVIPGINGAHTHLELQPVNEVDVHLKTMNPKWDEVGDAIAATTG